ncbi:MAG: hypothetical protein ACLUKN_16480 [Bacilli bacterium]
MPWTDAEVRRYRKAQEHYAKEVERQRGCGWNDDKQQNMTGIAETHLLR